MANEDIPLGKLQALVKATVVKSIEEAANLVYAKVVENASLTDHTLDQLAKLGHPYSVRNFKRMHTPNFLVHAQSNRLMDNIKLIKRSETHYVINISKSDVPYIDYVINGTRYMVARDFITGSFNEVKPSIAATIFSNLDNLFRTVRGQVLNRIKRLRDAFR